MVKEVRKGRPFIEIIKYPALFSQVLGSFMGRFLDKAHHGLGGFQGFIGIVRDVQLVEHIRKTHHPQADFAVAAHHFGNFRKRVF